MTWQFIAKNMEGVYIGIRRVASMVCSPGDPGNNKVTAMYVSFCQLSSLSVDFLQPGPSVRPLIAARQWPDAIDSSALLFFFAVSLAVPLLGYVIMYVDIRAYYRALKGVLVRVANHFPRLPSWALFETPGCLTALGLSLPCTESEVKRAYRALAEQHHPDRGGDPQDFSRLREHFEASIAFIRAYEPAVKAAAESASERARVVGGIAQDPARNT